MVNTFSATAKKRRPESFFEAGLHKDDGVQLRDIYLQVFEDSSRSEPLWFIEDGTGGAITSLLPSDY